MKALHLIEETHCHHNGYEEQSLQSDVLLADMMAVVNQTQKSSTMVTCKVSMC